MIHDEDLGSSLDYSEGQKMAAHRVLVELVNLFNLTVKPTSLYILKIFRKRDRQSSSPVR